MLISNECISSKRNTELRRCSAFCQIWSMPSWCWERFRLDRTPLHFHSVWIPCNTSKIAWSSMVLCMFLCRFDLNWNLCQDAVNWLGYTYLYVRFRVFFWVAWVAGWSEENLVASWNFKRDSGVAESFSGSHDASSKAWMILEMSRAVFCLVTLVTLVLKKALPDFRCRWEKEKLIPWCLSAYKMKQMDLINFRKRVLVWRFGRLYGISPDEAEEDRLLEQRRVDLVPQPRLNQVGRILCLLFSWHSEL